ncbi:selenocysteinyl-tRNA-specific translation factor [Magnetospirillum sp. LM-5]|nr:selenocysteinyl-tRNA-specific translation factor [Magnetospirillum sp. LM-5]
MIVCTAGHIDHGKTALVRALTGIDADRLAEEKARGITIDLGFAYQDQADGRVLGFVDVPGHERFVHNMLAGVSGLDFALLVVACDDGVMPQTIEHLHILDLLGLSRGLVALTKADLADQARLAEVEAQVRALLAATALADAPIVAVSARTGQGVDTVATHLALASAGTVREQGGLFRLAVDRSFTLAGAGVVVTGTAFSGRVAVGDRLWLSPMGREVRVRSLHAQNRKADQGFAGQRLALNLAAAQLGKDDIARGEWVLDAGLHHPVDRFDAHFRLLNSEPRALAHWTPVHLHLAAAHVPARIALLDGDSLAPGRDGLVQLVLDRPIGALAGDRFILRDQSARRTIGGGRVLDLFPPARGRRTPMRLDILAAAQSCRPEQVLAQQLDRAPGWVDLDRLRLQWNAPELAVPDMIAAGRFAFRPATWQALRAGLVEVLGAYHQDHADQPGLQAPRLKSAVDPKMAADLFGCVVAAAIADGVLDQDGPWLRLPGHQARLSPADERVWDEARPLLGGDHRFRPPRVRDLAEDLDVPEAEMRGVMKRVARMGRVVLVAQDHYFLRETMAEMAAIAADCAQQAKDGWLIAARFRDRLDNGRKVAILILEYFDRVGLTIRKGDLRKVRADRLTLFGPGDGRESSPVGRTDFKSGNGRSPAVGGFDSHSLPPS